MKKNKIWIAALEGTFKEIEITEEELPRALWNYKFFLPGIYQGGSGIIKAITPDHVQSMGWNKGHRATPEDWQDIRNELGRSLENTVSNIKFLIEDSKNLLEMENKIKSLPSGQLQLSGIKPKLALDTASIGTY